MDFEIKVNRDPAGYSQGTWGYTVTDDDRCWVDGGYPCAELAMAAARRLVRREVGQ